jgi:hypothetical protein
MRKILVNGNQDELLSLLASSYGRRSLAGCRVSGHSTSRGSLAALPRSWYRRA